MTIEEKSRPLLDAIRRQFPQFAHLTPVIKYHRPEMKDIRRDADESYFQPEEGHTIEIVFEDTAAPAHPASQPEARASEAELRLVRALHRIASDPRYNFVALKWFRDSILPGEGFAPDEARATLDAAIARGWVVIERLANPNSTYPTATLRLNQEDAELRAVLAAPARPAPVRRGFAPVHVPGVSLSEEVLRGRR